MRSATSSGESDGNAVPVTTGNDAPVNGHSSFESHGDCGVFSPIGASSDDVTASVVTMGDNDIDALAVNNDVNDDSVRGCGRCGNLYRGNQEALGWAVDSIPRGIVIVGPVVFLSTALIKLAKEAAGCVVEIPDGEDEAPECNKRVYGIRPSSILTVYSLVVGLASAALMPVAGAIIDHTKYRRAVGRVSALLMSVITFVQIFISERTWFAIAILQIFALFFHYVRTLCAFAYLPELTRDQNTLIKWTASFSIIMYLSMVFFLAFVVGVTTVAGINDDDVATARVSQSVVFIVAASCFGYAWTKLFGFRLASQHVPEGSTLVTAGFRKLYHTLVHLHSNNRALFWFLVALSLSEAAMLSLTTIAVTYTTEQLDFSASDNGIAILILLLSSVPGSIASTYFNQKHNPVRSLQACLVLAAVTTGLASLILVRPGQKAATFGIATGWGVATGWKYPTERAIYCTLLPESQDAEFMGIFLFVGNSLSWLPPLVFTATNEAGVSMRVGFATLDIFFIGASLVLFLIGNYKEAVERAKENEGNGNGDGSSRETGQTETAGDEVMEIVSLQTSKTEEVVDVR